MTDNMNILAPAILAVLLAVGFIWRSFWVKKTTGENPDHLHYDESLMGLCGRVYRLFSVVTFLYLSARLIYPEIDLMVGPITFLMLPTVMLVGMGLGIVAVSFALYAQAFMATSWRIGIPDDTPGELVSNGPFAISRNPFFLGSMVFYMSVFFMVPNALTLVVMTSLMITTNMQTRLEEEFLSKTLGEPYDAYKAKVRRWL